MSWHTSTDPARAGLPVDRWPLQFRLAWEQAKARRPGPFRKNGGGVRRTVATLLKSEKGLRRWLGFLYRTGRLENGGDLHELLTPEILEEYFVHLVTCGNADRSIVGRFQELKLVFELMHPGRNFGWLTKPQGVPLEHSLPMRTRPLFVPSSADLLDWADELFRHGVEKQDRQIRWAQVRDALMIAILADRGPRLHALASLRLGKHVYRTDAEWLLEQDASITKTRNTILLPLSPDVGEMTDRYVSVERPEMLRGRACDAFWISWHGRPLAQTSISGLVWRRTLERFGIGFGPHRFRKSLTTTLAMGNPSAPLDAPTILGHSPKTSLDDYNRATAMAASRRHDERLRELRRETEDLARRAFGNRL